MYLLTASRFRPPGLRNLLPVQIELRAGHGSGMTRWRKRLFFATSHPSRLGKV
jgi:hypothetical protein